MSRNDDPPDAPPPSYSEAMSQPAPHDVPNLPARPPQPPQRPPAQPPRPSQSSNPVDSLYTNNPSLPFKYPRGSYCRKCSNTGYRKGEICRQCWFVYFLNKNAYNPNPNLPFKYPKKHLCSKCNNTGIKLKNGKSCKDCWEFFGPRNRPNYTSGTTSYSHGMGLDGLFGTTTNTTYVTTSYGPQPGPPPGMFRPPPAQYGPPPMRVNPGDPRIGGILCGRCRGTGMVWSFIDEVLCPSCSGLGRIIH